MGITLVVLSDDSAPWGEGSCNVWLCDVGVVFSGYWCFYARRKSVTVPFVTLLTKRQQQENSETGS